MNTQAGLFLEPNTAENNEAIIKDSKKEEATIPGNGNGNGEVPPGQTEGEDGTITNPGGNTPPGLNKGDRPEKPDNPHKPPKPDKPGEDGSDAKAQKGTHVYTYDTLNRVVTGDVAKVKTTYEYDTLGNLVLEKAKNNVVDYQYNNLNQLVKKSIKKDITTHQYDKRGNRLSENGKKASQSFVYDATNHLVKGTNWKGETSEYTYNALFVRVNQSQTNNGNKTYARDYVIDYTSYERNDLAVDSPNYMAQKHVYTAWGERLEQFTERGNWDRLLYVHEDVMGNTMHYTKATGQSFGELRYDVWGAPTLSGKLLNNDNGNFVAANFTGHTYDTVLDIYFAEARFYDAKNRQWMASDPIKDGLNWYSYVGNNPTTYFDPNGEFGILAALGVVAVGGVISGGINAIAQLASGTPIKDLNWGNIGKSALAGAVGTAAGLLTGGALSTVAAGTTGALTGGLTITQQIGVSMLSGTAGGMASTYSTQRMDGASPSQAMATATNPSNVGKYMLTSGALSVAGSVALYGTKNTMSSLIDDLAPGLKNGAQIAWQNVKGFFVKMGCPLQQSQNVAFDKTMEITTQQQLQQIATKANQTVQGSGTVPGTLKHTEFARQVKALGNTNLGVEVSYKNGQLVDYGTRGSVRLDVVEYNKNGTIKAIYDLKTGVAGLTQSRIQQIQNAVGAKVPVMEVRP